MSVAVYPGQTLPFIRALRHQLLENQFDCKQVFDKLLSRRLRCVNYKGCTVRKALQIVKLWYL